MFFFFIKFIITNILFSIILCSIFIRLNKYGKLSNPEILLYSLGLGPAFTTLLLYYFFLTIPYRSNLFYLILIAAVYFLIALIGRKSFKHLFSDITSNVKKVFTYRRSVRYQIEHIILIAIICVPLAIYLYVYSDGPLVARITSSALNQCIE